MIKYLFAKPEQHSPGGKWLDVPAGADVFTYHQEHAGRALLFGLILAAIALLYTVWQSDIQEALDYQVDRHYLDAADEHQKLKTIYWQRAVPLCLAAALMALIFIPESYRIIRDSVNNLINKGFQEAIKDYDATAVILVAVNITFFVMAVYFLSLVRKLREKHLQFEAQRLQDENLAT